MNRYMMYVGGLGPYREVNNIYFPEKTVVEVPEEQIKVLKYQSKFIEVKGISYLKESGTFSFLTKGKK